MRFFLFFFLLLMGIFSSPERLFAKANGVFKEPKKQLDSLIIVSCSGKSGSTTLLKSFRALHFETYHYHRIPEDVYPYILDRAKDTNVLLIDSIRDIIARKISSYFHHLTTHVNLSREEILSSYKKDRISFLKRLQTNLDKKIIKIAGGSGGYGFKNWKKLNYNCLKDGVFDFKKKYQLKQIGNLYFVNLRFDDIAHWQRIIRSIDLPIDLSNFKIVEANRSADKWYGEIYKDFIEYFTITQKHFDTILSTFSEELAHFYTDQEIEDFINKWKPHIRA